MASKIEWTDYTRNPVKGLCPVGCSYCYARRLYRRFKWNPDIRYDPYWWKDIAVLRKPGRIFVGSTMELFGEWVKPEWMNSILEYCRRLPQHTFIFLTKKPENLPREWPDNCWVGVTATEPQAYHEAAVYLSRIRAAVRYVSIEPMLHRFWIDRIHSCFDWIIIGQQTPVRKSAMPDISWVKEIVQAADQAPITPVFLKDNLKPLLVECEDGIEYAPLWANGGHGTLRQEMPKL